MPDIAVLFKQTLAQAGKAFSEFHADSLERYLRLLDKLKRGEELAPEDREFVGFYQGGWLDVTAQLQASHEIAKRTDVSVGMEGVGFALRGGFSQSSIKTEQSNLSIRAFANFAIQAGTIERVLEAPGPLPPMAPAGRITPPDAPVINVEPRDPLPPGG